MRQTKPHEVLDYRRRTGRFKRKGAVKRPPIAPVGGGDLGEIETFIHILGDPYYELTIKPYAQIHKTGGDRKKGEVGDCKHGPKTSSWVAVLGLAVLKRGGVAIYVRFGSGDRIAYTFADDDHAAEVYEEWKAAPSKGKFLHARMMDHPYISL